MKSMTTIHIFTDLRHDQIWRRSIIFHVDYKLIKYILQMYLYIYLPVRFYVCHYYQLEKTIKNASTVNLWCILDLRTIITNVQVPLSFVYWFTFQFCAMQRSKRPCSYYVRTSFQAVRKFNKNNVKIVDFPGSNSQDRWDWRTIR